MGSAIEEVLIDHGVQLHIPRRMQKYFQASCQTHAKEMSEAVEKNSRRRQRSEAGER
jgi:hypothetical protein